MKFILLLPKLISSNNKDKNHDKCTLYGAKMINNAPFSVQRVFGKPHKH